MVRIRLSKPGKSIKRRYHTKIVVIESTRSRDSRFLEQVGFYDPSRDILKIDIDRYKVWVKNGAKPTETVASLFKRHKRQSGKDKEAAAKVKKEDTLVLKSKIETQEKDKDNK